ncbi:hypothetical protein JTB14_017657 [Gonioctena quinquepunctata]|nr:hypothetical protein JTB14_017657 [Gonioctena quinquepunctata]
MSEIYNSIFDKKSIDDSHILPSKYRLTHSFRTITDPTFPVFKRDGTAVSRQYCEEHIAGGSKLFQNNHNASGNEFNSKAKPVSTSNASALPKTTISLETSRKERLKKSMELALNSLNMELETTSESSTFSHYSSGVPQTPLMSKLSMVPSEENTESSSTSQYHKISALMNPLFPSQTYKTRGNNEELECKKKTGLKKCVLFVCGQKNIVLTMLLEEEAAKEQNTVKKMWDICTDRLSRLENDLRYSIESSNNFESEPYRYLQHDSEWLSVKRGGPWNGNDLESLHYLHDDFHDTDHNLTEILIRSSDNIIYGHHSGSSEVFYSETANFIAGLPPPVDPMGLLQIKAKKRLERDHGLEYKKHKRRETTDDSGQGPTGTGKHWHALKLGGTLMAKAIGKEPPIASTSKECLRTLQRRTELSH